MNKLLRGLRLCDVYSAAALSVGKALREGLTIALWFAWFCAANFPHKSDQEPRKLPGSQRSSIQADFTFQDQV